MRGVQVILIRFASFTLALWALMRCCIWDWCSVAMCFPSANLVRWGRASAMGRMRKIAATGIMALISTLLFSIACVPLLGRPQRPCGSSWLRNECNGLLVFLGGASHWHQ